jgi:predicted site-specific integrase-resolvase
MAETIILDRRYTEDETAALLGLSRTTLRRLERAGLIRAFRPSPRKVCYLDPDIAEFVNRRGVQRHRPQPPRAA